MTEEILFAEALSRPPEGRAAFLAQACAGRPELRAAVEALLAAHDRPGHVLDRPPADLGQTVDSAPGATPEPGTSGYTLRPDLVSPDSAPGLVIGGRYTLVEK